MKSFLFSVALFVFLLCGGWILLAFYLFWKLIEEGIRIGDWPFDGSHKINDSPPVHDDPAWGTDDGVIWIEPNRFDS